MQDLPAIALLESTHAFPCRYTFKVIGRAEANFVGRVLAAVRRELPADAEPSFSSRKTAAGRHVSVTIEPDVATAAAVLAIYRTLREVDGLVLLL
jgi:putative lipoic acid-binding regulatory protein